MGTALDILEEKNRFIDSNENSIPIEKLMDEGKFILQFIPKFFSLNGEANKIREMYRAIETDICDKKLLCSDVYVIGNIYKEYIDGMLEFIEDIKNVPETNVTSIKGFKEKFIKAKENDAKFIDALYNGNVSDKSDLSLKEAVLNIEYLIDLIPYANSMMNKCKDMDHQCDDCANNDKTKLIRESMNLLFDSVRRYLYVTTKVIVDTYYRILETIKVCQEKPEEKFVLF